MKKIIILIVVLFSLNLSAKSQKDTLKLSLREVVDMAKSKSIASKQAITTKETKYWQYKTYKSNYQPQLALHGILPGYNKTFIPVQQPNGTVYFQPVHNNNSSLNLDFSQVIGQTGGTIFGTTLIQRFDDFDRKNTLYNAVPYGIGYSQPLFQFNKYKWDKEIEPLKYKESTQAYTESMEQIAMNANTYFFDLLVAQVNLQIADTNLKNNHNIIKVANLKFELGKITRNEILQLQLEELKAQKAVGVAKRDMEIALLNLKSFTGIQTNSYVELIPPANNIAINPDTATVIKQAYENRSDAIAFVRRINEAKRDVAMAKGQNGLNANLTARLGFSKSAESFAKVYQSPQDQQLVQLEFVVPILDWGRSKSRSKTAEANQLFTKYAVEQDKQIFSQQITTQVTLFNMMKEQLKLTASADSIASEKYQIAKDRYLLGNLSITDLSIAFQEKDQAKRDFITTLRDLWASYYSLRYLSLYDFELLQKITYK
ncbi:MAG: TolC family protein [Ginsengibacter sp.]